MPGMERLISVVRETLKKTLGLFEDLCLLVKRKKG
jgi:hypothetical protein